MTVLFVARHFTYFRNFESVVAAMAELGHRVHLAADREEALGGRELVDRLAARFPDRVTVGFTPILQWGRYRRLSGALRLGLDYLRYSDERYETTPKIRERAYERTPFFVLALARLPFRGLVTRALERLEQAVPRQKGVDEFVTELKPDVLLITPLIELGSPQLDYVRAARALGIRSALCVWSWDHLSSKALIRDAPDALFVWNDLQKREAMSMHRLPEDRIVVTGAQCYDRWFGRLPTRSRAEFVHHAGLSDERPYVLWTCSALLPGTPPEPGIFLRWASHLRRSSDPRVRDVPILLRPHPSRTAEWANGEWRSVGNVVMFGGPPVDERGREDYFESLYYSAAVVGITTSAFLEAAVVGRPVMSFYDDDLIPEHEASLHFQYLVDARDGLLTMAASLDEHERQLASVLTGPAPDVLLRQRRFVRNFVRPRGIDVPATQIVSDALERLPHRPRPAQAAAAFALGRLGLRHLHRMQGDPRWRHLILDEREVQREARVLDKAKIRAQELTLKRAAKAQALARKRAERGR
jgi:hypothetical protein